MRAQAEASDEAAAEVGSAGIYLRLVGDAWVIGRRPVPIVVSRPNVEISKKCPSPFDLSPYLLKNQRPLRDACHAMRKDDNGRYCSQCNVRDFCNGQARRTTREASP